ncbi:RNA polymerase factor sigma-54 [Clostridium senegalense]|uniref:RNA polymerase factor sigma-54 n=1 Tax=Clostridium senegalense TaxID=1465809 RepID=A0A6M0H0X5_9CLOT|nr:RNA polymerase factor sigma-54 [Clostridium senegalense]NEU03804.1 RNA polymerase factor sigma-54 [Clostridium senegalense]
MNLGFDLKLSMEQKLVMTMEMQLSIKLLQMSTYDLMTYINKELEENIALESKDDNKLEAIDLKKLINFLDDNKRGKDYDYYKEKDEEISPLNFVVEKESLKDYLKKQLIDFKMDKVMFRVCLYIIESLNHKGYFEEDIEETANRNKCSIQDVNKALGIIQSLEPEGIGARNLKECLKIQLDKKKIKDECIYIIIDNHLQDISKGKLLSIAKELKIDGEKVQYYIDVIRTLEPKPSRGFFTGDETNYIIPDAVIKRIDDEFIVIMNDSMLPKLNINNTYKEVLNNCDEKETVDYVKEKVNKAIFLMKSIESRRNTLQLVIEDIINIQKKYFLYGTSHLKPMTIKVIADNLEFHESTVSRAIKDKYIALPTGKVIRIKDLFTNSISTDGEDISTYNIKKKIEEIIENEDKKKPLSDSKICEILNDDGINISRRTIAKYREELGILSSSRRKRL